MQKTIPIIIFIFLSAGLCANTPERLSESEPRLPKDTIHTVVVTGTRTPKPLKDVPVQTRVITSADIGNVDATGIADLLQTELPAIEFTYGMDQQTSVNMQGFGGASVLFLVDGERLAGETLDNVDYARLGMENVGRIEIVKGAASSLYGSNAVGGVVNIITRDAEKPWAVNLNTRYGSHNAWRNGVSASFDQGRFNSVTDFRHTVQDATLLGYTPYTYLGQPVRMPNYQYGYRTYSVKEKLRFRVSDKIDLTARGGYFFRQRDASELTRERYRAWSYGLRMEYKIDERNWLEVSAAFDQYDKSDFHTTVGIDERDYRNIQNTVRALYNHTLTGGHILTVGGDAMSDDLVSYQFSGGTGHRQYSADAFAQFDWRVAQKVNLVGGARLDYFSRLDRPALSPKLAFMYRPGDFALRASYGGGFRTPTLKEMYMDFFMGNIFMIYGNQELKSQTSHNFNLSGEFTRGRLSATVSGYYNHIRDRITTVWNASRGGMEYVNTGKMSVAGVETGIYVKLPWGLGARASYAYTRETVHGGGVNTSATRPHSAVARLEYGRYRRNYGFNVSLSGRWMSPVVAYELTGYLPPVYEKVHYPGYTIWNLVVSQKIRRPFTLTARVDNLFGYKTPGYRGNSPVLYGTAFHIGLSMNIEEFFSN